MSARATLEQLRQAEAELRERIEREAYLNVTGNQPCDLATLAERSSEIKKEISALTVGQIFTA